jgi:hypothetical protein
MTYSAERRRLEMGAVGPRKFETCPVWGARKIAVSILFLTGDPGSPLELAVDV